MPKKRAKPAKPMPTLVSTALLLEVAEAEAVAEVDVGLGTVCEPETVVTDETMATLAELLTELLLELL